MTTEQTTSSIHFNLGHAESLPDGLIPLLSTEKTPQIETSKLIAYLESNRAERMAVIEQIKGQFNNTAQVFAVLDFILSGRTKQERTKIVADSLSNLLAMLRVLQYFSTSTNPTIKNELTAFCLLTLSNQPFSIPFSSVPESISKAVLFVDAARQRLLSLNS